MIGKHRAAWLALLFGGTLWLHTGGVQAHTYSKDFASIDSMPHDTTRMLREVMVQAKRITTPHQTISYNQIQSLPSSSVADALKYMAGVQIKDYGGLGGQKTVNVRSLGAQHVGVYLDGVRITNVQNGTVDLGKYSLSTLESVSLYNANKAEMLMMASEYASASTVYLKTHRPDSTEFRASYQYGSFNTHKAQATYSFRNIGFVDASYTHTTGNYPFEYHTQYEDTTGRRRNSDLTVYRIEACAFHKGLQWHTYYFNSRRGLPGGIVRRLSGAYTDVGREWDRNFFSQLTYRANLGKEVGIRGIVKYANDFLHYRSDYLENISVHANNRYHQQDVYGAWAVSYTHKGFGTSASVDGRWSDLTTDVKNFHYVYRLDYKSALSAFYTYKGLNLSAAGLYTRVTDHTNGKADPLSKVTWNTLASYTLGGWTFRTFYKSVFRTPTLNDLYYTLVGNRNLKPEYTKQWDAGVAYTYTDNVWSLNLQADYYYNHVKDRIVCLPLKGSYQWTMLNYGYTRCMGVDITANVRYKQHSLLLTGTFQDDRNRTDPTEDAYNDYIAYSPRWSFTAVYTFLYKGWTASLSHMFVDKRYWTAENAIEDPLNAYNCTDLKVGYHFAQHLQVEAECQDLFDERYEMIQRWPMPGRRYAITLKYTL
jgi:outer membrane cobalamin receptor